MKLSLFIALRYIFSKSNKNVVNTISWVSIIAISVVSAAMFIVLSGFNGIEKLVKQMYNEFDAELKIEHKDHKFFIKPQNILKTLDHDNIAFYSDVLEDKCIFRSGGKTEIGSLKGVDSNFFHSSLLPTKLVDGEFIDFNNSYANIVLGESLRSKLGVGVGNTYSQVDVWIPRPDKKVTSIDFTKDFRSQKYFTIGSFSISPEYDPIYGLSDIKYARKVMNLKEEVSSIEIRLKDSSQKDDTQKYLQDALEKNDLVVKNIEEQHADFLKYVNLEKGFVVFIFVLIILLAAFNLVGSLTILTIEKEKDLKTLLHLGGNMSFIKGIFWNLNYLMNGIGLVLGLILGFIVCYLQQEYSFLLMGAGNVGIPYPVSMKLNDVFLLIVLVFIVSTVCSSFSIRKIKVNTL